MFKLLSQQSREFLETLLQERWIKSLLSLLEEYHPETYHHSQGVALLSLDLGYDNQLRSQDLYTLGCGALLHDIGKIKVPLNILSKSREEITTGDLEILRMHPRYGLEILQERRCDDSVIDLVVGHHEFKKERPYPRSGFDRRKKPRRTRDRRKTNTEIITQKQILAVSDIYHSLISKRTYKPAFSNELAAEIIVEEFSGERKYINQILARNT